MRTLIFRLLCPFVIVWFGSQVALAEGLSVADWYTRNDVLGFGKWQSLGSSKGVKRWRKKLPGQDVYAVKGQLEIHQPIEKVAGVIMDESRWAEWSQATKSARMLSADGGMKTVYQQFKMPPFIDDRHLIYTFGMSPVENGWVIIGRTMKHKSVPNTKGVEMRLYEGRWHLEAVHSGVTRVTFEALIDPQGNLPKWFVNFAQKNYAPKTLHSLARQAGRADVRALSLAH